MGNGSPVSEDPTEGEVYPVAGLSVSGPGRSRPETLTAPRPALGKFSVVTNRKVTRGTWKSDRLTN